MDWQQFLPMLRIDQIAYAGIVAFIIYRILTGKLSPESVTNDLRAERDSWKQAYLNESKAGTVKDGQIAELIEVARTANHVLKSLPRAGGDGDVVQQNTQPAR